MARLSKQQVFKAPLKTEEVEVEEWGGSVLISEMPVKKRNQLMARFITPDGKESDVSTELELDLFIASCKDPEFSHEDAEALQAVSGAAVGRVAAMAMQLNGLGKKAQDEARGNS
ncbi:MAG: hypothetical protein QG592_1246 [Pseudomonadota bacterium]|nr:hypothetical protein [Pseudomonadota bacterium]